MSLGSSFCFKNTVHEWIFAYCWILVLFTLESTCIFYLTSQKYKVRSMFWDKLLNYLGQTNYLKKKHLYYCFDNTLHYIFIYEMFNCWDMVCNIESRTHISKHAQPCSHLCLWEFAPVWFQVVNNAIKSSWQWDTMNKQDHQDQIWEHSCEIYNLHTHTDTILYCSYFST